MNIGIDARLYGTEHTGLGRYVKKLTDNLLRFDKKNNYTLFLDPRHINDLPIKPNRRLKIVPTKIRVYSFAEQIFLPKLFYKENLDLIHIPHFNAPFLYLKKKILTVHDLIKHSSRGKDTTTRNWFFYTIIRIAYLFLVGVVTKQAKKILVPSQYVKDDLVRLTGVSSSKVVVTYEAASDSIKKVILTKKESQEILQRYGLVQPFLVYTGNVYPHKNIDILIEAIDAHNQKKELDIQLAIICARSVFYDRLKQKVENKGLEKKVKLLGYLDDEEISKVYSLALALVHPSKMEGFGLTGIEAMGCGLPVISSNATCLPEIYGEAVLYFDPNDLSELLKKIEQIISDRHLRSELVEKGYRQALKYSWEKMAEETIAVYNSIPQQ